jgi:hypothetical protein
MLEELKLLSLSLSLVQVLFYNLGYRLSRLSHLVGMIAMPMDSCTSPSAARY